MKHLSISLFALAAVLATATTNTRGQFQIKLPGIPKVEKPKTVTMEKPEPKTNTSPDSVVSTGTSVQKSRTGGPSIDKTRVQFWPWGITSYKGDYDVWSWLPRIKFKVEGALPSGTHFYVEVGQPGGAAWVKVQCEDRGPGSYSCDNEDALKDRATVATGVFPFSIKMRNELAGSEQTLFAGKAKIEKALAGGNILPTSKKFVFYANHDWGLPIAQVYYDEKFNWLYVKFLVRGDSTRLEPHLFYRGQEVTMNWAGGIVKGGTCGGYDLDFRPSTSVTDKLPQGAMWTGVQCGLRGAQARPNEDNPGAHVISANPGEYEVKVLRNNKLSRSIKFTVGPDGRIMDNGRGASIGLPHVAIVPVMILDDQDGPWDKNAWRSDALYGNPIAGFSIQ